MSTNARISSIREHLKKHHLDALVIPSSDPHQSEYIADHWKSREWVSGFDGSAGIAVITMNHAGLWTDSRYFLQAEQQLELSEFQLHKIENRESPGFKEWLSDNLEENATVAIDGWSISKKQVNSIRQSLNKSNIQLITHLDIIASVWTNRPSLPISKAFLLEEEFSGRSASEKIKVLRKHIFTSKAQHYLISDLAEIAWILNIRGQDIECNPVVIAYLIVSLDSITLYINETKTLDIKEYLNSINVTVREYATINKDVQKLKGKILIDDSLCNAALYDLIDRESIVNISSIVSTQKTIKNKVELENFRKAMIKDGIALSKAYYWLDKNIDNGVSEFEFGEKLAEFRGEQENYFGESFSPIVGYNGNGAIIHYRAVKETSSIINRNGMLLCDSGAQFKEGTTDITRTFCFDTPTAAQKKAYTLVLKGHIGLASAKFPKGTKGVQLDILARMPLWKENMNYGHGTGHGVGHFLNVHEGPQGFDSGNSSRGKYPLMEGMVTSNEPGYYEESKFGIRIENLIVTKQSSEAGFLEFETITLYPIYTKLIELDLLKEEEKQWINDYHALVWEKLSPMLDEEIKNWLKPQCLPI